MRVKKNTQKPKSLTFQHIFRADFKRNNQLYIMMIPVIAYFVVMCYLPMYGALIAFMDYRPSLGFWGSDWVGLKHFMSFLTLPSFGTIFMNTVRISIATLLFGFPAPIILALLMHEIHCKPFLKITQNITYLPHFISLVVVCGLIKEFTKSDGLIGDLVAMFGGTPVSLLNYAENFVPIYVISNIWQEVGWGTIIYLAALTSIDRQLYEAAEIDGAGKFKQMLHVTLPGIVPTIIIMLTMRMGQMLNVGYEKIILLYNDAVMSRADVISTYVYRKGLIDLDWSFSTAVGLFNSVINFALLIFVNGLNKKLQSSSLW